MKKFFNTAGPVDCKRHYCVPPLERFDLEYVLELIDQQKYFVLHAPRQTGKTSSMLALMDYLNKERKYTALYINVEAAQGARENVFRGIRAILNELAGRADYHIGDNSIREKWFDILNKSGEDAAFNEVLSWWASQAQKPVVLFIDEIDSLIGDTLISVLRQVRSGYDKRPGRFPGSVILCGVRDVRDYRIHSDKEKAVITGGSAFNIKAESLRVGNFNENEVNFLFDEHTKETGQIFEAPAKNLVWDLTSGQPWLVNALAYEACFRIKQGRNRQKTITEEMITKARENLILRRETHLDQLADKLKEPRVRSVIEPVMTGVGKPENIPPDDLDYVTDLGLIKKNGSIKIANKIYQEIIPRQLTYSTQLTIVHESAWYVKPDGRLDTDKLMRAFQEFFREHSQHWLERFQYKEAGPQLLLQAFLQRIVNSGGSIDREYGLGRGRTDLFITWPHKNGLQKIVMELKIKHKSLKKTIEDGLVQTGEYMDRCNADEGHLIIFDRTKGKSWKKKIFEKKQKSGEYIIKIWGM